MHSIFIWCNFNCSCSQKFSVNKASWPIWNILLLSQCYDMKNMNCSALTVTCVTQGQQLSSELQPGWRLTLAAWRHLVSVYVLHANTYSPVCRLRSQVNSSLSSSSSYHPAKYSLWLPAVKIQWIKTGTVGLVPGARTQWRVLRLWGFVLLWGCNYFRSHMTTSLCGPHRRDSKI